MAVTGKTRGAGLFEMMELLGKDTVLQRMRGWPHESDRAQETLHPRHRRADIRTARTRAGSTPASRPSRTAISTSATPSPSASTSGWPPTTAGLCNLRFDDTNPETEEIEYVESIKEDVRWLGFDWEDREFYASDYFEKLYEFAVDLIQKGKAYVCDLSADEVSAQRGTLTEPGQESPYRSRSIEENLDLFRRMRAGEFPDGSKSLRAKIDMAHPNLLMRDPVMYRIRRAHHYRRGDAWCIYPTYDWAHGQSDSIEGVTHSICTLEFEVHRPLYDWFLDELGIHHPQQIEFARLNLSHTVLSKRKLLELVKEGRVSGWDDPRMPTISGLRRRGYTPGAIRIFCDLIGVAKANSIVDMALLENCVREDLNKSVSRVMAVLRPLKVVIDQLPRGQGRGARGRQQSRGRPAWGRRRVPFSRVLYIERDDFMEDPPEEVLPPLARPGGPPALRLFHHLHWRSSRTRRPARSSSSTAPTIRPPAAAIRRTGARSRPPSTGCRPPTRSTAEVRLYETLFTKRDPARSRKGRTGSRT